MRFAGRRGFALIATLLEAAVCVGVQVCAALDSPGHVVDDYHVVMPERRQVGGLVRHKGRGTAHYQERVLAGGPHGLGDGLLLEEAHADVSAHAVWGLVQHMRHLQAATPGSAPLQVVMTLFYRGEKLTMWP